MNCCVKYKSNFCGECGKDLRLNKKIRELLNSTINPKILFNKEFIINETKEKIINLQINEKQLDKLNIKIRKIKGIKLNHNYIIYNNSPENSFIEFLKTKNINILSLKNVNNLTIEKLLILLIKNKISSPYCINKNNYFYTWLNNKNNDYKLIIDFSIPQDNFIFLDNIKYELYLLNEKLYTLEEINKLFDVEFKLYNIDLNQHSTDFVIKNINIKILNEQFEKMYHIASMRKYYTHYDTLQNKTELDDSTKLLCLLGFKKLN